MKTNGYMMRALKARDPRYARILGKLGYDRSDMRAEEPDAVVVEDIAAVRAEYLAVVGKRPFNGWDIPTLRVKIAEAKSNG